jgi:hypothetical protein
LFSAPVWDAVKPMVKVSCAGADVADTATTVAKRQSLVIAFIGFPPMEDIRKLSGHYRAQPQLVSAFQL